MDELEPMASGDKKMRGVISYKDKVLSYRTKGTGFPVLLIHGFGEDSGIWTTFSKPLYKNFKVITFDIPGAGKSGFIETLNVEEIAKICNLILQLLHIDKCVLVGHSMGGYAALAFAELFPGKLKGLVLFHSHPYADSEEKKKGRRKSIEFLEKQGTPKYVEQLVPKLYAPTFIQKNKKIVKAHIKTARAFSKKSMIGLLKLMIKRPDRSQVLSKIQVPVLFIIGKKDQAINMDDSFNQTALPKISIITVLKKTGHMGMIEEKKKTRKSIKSFINYCCSLNQ